MSPDSILLRISFLVSGVLRLDLAQQFLHLLLMTEVLVRMSGRCRNVCVCRKVNRRLNCSRGLVSPHMVQVWTEFRPSELVFAIMFHLLICAGHLVVTTHAL